MWSVLLLSVGVLVSVINFYLSFLRYPIHIAGGGKKDEFKWVSGLPLIGTVFVVAALLLDGLERSLILYPGLFALMIDTGGVLWFIGQEIYQRIAGQR